MRAALRLVLLLAVVLLVSPFLISSLLLDSKGIPLDGHITAKDEYIRVSYADWTRKLNLTVQYSPPDGYGVAFTRQPVTLAEFDRSKLGDRLPLRYLLATDLPPLPGTRTLRQMHALFVVRFADTDTWSGPQAFMQSHAPLIASVLAAMAFLLGWRLFRLPGFAWVLAASALAGVALSVWIGYPRPLPPPRRDLRTATGTIKALDRWEWLFRDNHSEGFNAKQAIQIASVEFVPLGATQPVLAVDLIDNGSLPNLREQALVKVIYEASAPRTAYIEGASRTFARRNLEGIVQDALLTLLTLALLWIGSLLLGRFYRKLINRPRPA